MQVGAEEWSLSLTKECLGKARTDQPRSVTELLGRTSNSVIRKHRKTITLPAQAQITLGSIVFQDFEIPQEMPFGGAHMLVVKKLVGGDRVIDAMGRDDAEKAWSGRFRGSAAEARGADARSAQDRRATTASDLVVAALPGRDRQVRGAVSGSRMEIPYSISCTVIQDLSAPILPMAPTADASIFGDINGAGTLASQINISAIVATVAKLPVPRMR